MATDNARKLRLRMQSAVTAESKAAMLNMRGVSAINHNDWHDASQDFLQAYSLDPNSAFSINNRGYVAEMDGDLETAEFFYEKARRAQDANVPVGLATRRSAEGMKLFEVVNDSRQKVDARIEDESQVRQRQAGPIGLKSRDNQPIAEPAESQTQTPVSPKSLEPGPAPAPSQPPGP
jgi:tetratricopeptide (TPR) repeat protein